MKILVFGQPLVVGGTQVNGIELATALRDDFGHTVVYHATPGPMLELLEEKGLRFIAAPEAACGFHPDPRRMRAIYRVVKAERPDVIHAWDWNQCLEAYFGAHLWLGVPLVVTDMMMDLYRMLPKRLPTTFGVPRLVDEGRAGGRSPLEVIVPPVDVVANAPGVVDSARFRQEYGVSASEVNLVIVSRLATWMKAESIRRTIDAVRVIGRERPVRLFIVGDGNARPELQKEAASVNSELCRAAVTLTGELKDPRPAYESADIVVGMGGSALRGMAFAKPVVVVGERGFCLPMCRENADWFYFNGIYGLGEGSADNQKLVRTLWDMVDCPERLAQLGKFSRDFVCEHFDLRKVSARLNAFLCDAASHQPEVGAAVFDGLRTAAIWMKERRFVPGMWRQRVGEFRERLIHGEP